MKTFIKSSLCVCALLAISACVTNKTDRALSGGAIGAGAGAIGSAVTGGNTATGAAIGGAVGAAAGAATDNDDVNLGDPAWK